MMEILQTYTRGHLITKGSTLAIGNFDGLHLGHKSILKVAQNVSLSPKVGVLTFEPHPREFFGKSSAAFRLMSAKSRRHYLEKVGIKILIELPFDNKISKLSAEKFCELILKNSLQVSHVVVGADFKFGKGRDGTTQTLHECGSRFDFKVTIAPVIKSGKYEISSTAIRLALSEGRTEDAKNMLGHWHSIDGVVIHGEKRGRTLGFPTINLSLDGLHLPKYGIYSTKVNILSGKFKGSVKGVASLGERPTFGKNAPNFEVHLLDFSGDLYGTEVSVELIKFQRKEEKYTGSQSLIEQMSLDCEIARKTLKKILLK